MPPEGKKPNSFTDVQEEGKGGRTVTQHRQIPKRKKEPLVIMDLSEEKKEKNNKEGQNHRRKGGKKSGKCTVNIIEGTHPRPLWSKLNGRKPGMDTCLKMGWARQKTKKNHPQQYLERPRETKC